MKMKLKKTLTAVSAAAVSAGAIAVLALAGQGLAFAQSEGDPIYSPGPGIASAGADIMMACKPAGSQPFANMSDPQTLVECNSNGRTTP